MYPSQPALRSAKPRRILLVGNVVELFRDLLYLARDVRPSWFFEVALDPESAARLLADHDVDVVVASSTRDGGTVLDTARELHPEVQRAAVVATHRFPRAAGHHDVTIDATASVVEQLAVLDAVLSPALRRSA